MESVGQLLRRYFELEMYIQAYIYKDLVARYVDLRLGNAGFGLINM